MGFSKRLKLLRKNADVTQDELAQYLQVSHPHCRIRDEKPTARL